jgi:CDGSH-type Zn-finger protein
MLRFIFRQQSTQIKSLPQVVASSCGSKRLFGGYIEDAQLSSLGLEVYQEIYGEKKLPELGFVVPKDDSAWPTNLWGYELGKGVEKHLKKYFSGDTGTANASDNTKIPEQKAQKERFNKLVDLYSKKVIDTISLQPGDKVFLCRCWQSEKFPYCDGSHGKHNHATGETRQPLSSNKTFYLLYFNLILQEIILDR